MNLANKITLFRLLIFIPFIVLLTIFFYYRNLNILLICSGIIFIISMASDFLDGYIARKQNTITIFGKLFDPIADKIITNTALIFLSIYGFLPVFIPVLFITRDVIVDGFRNIAASKNKNVAASIYGKLKTLVLFFGIVIVFFVNSVKMPIEVIQGINFFIYLGLALSIISGIQYFVEIKRFIILK